MLHAWMAPMALWLSRFDDGPQAALPALDRLALIDADLADPAMPLGPCPQSDSPPWPPNASAAYRWGVCYVVEGAQLGGAVLYRRLAAALAPHRLRYLQGEPAGPGPRWRAFLLALAAQGHNPAEIAEACQGACDAFDRLTGRL